MKSLRVNTVSEFNNELKLKGFKAYEIESQNKIIRTDDRKDLYKICINTGKNIIKSIK
jgi:AraC family transcriptional regulator, transcriptional activator of pobA